MPPPPPSGPPSAPPSTPPPPPHGVPEAAGPSEQHPSEHWAAVHGLAGIALVALTIAHIYFALRPEKLFITKSMILGWMSRENYLEHYDSERWPAGEEASRADRTGGTKSREVPAS